jgi:hypothetical protein
VFEFTELEQTGRDFYKMAKEIIIKMSADFEDHINKILSVYNGESMTSSAPGVEQEEFVFPELIAPVETGEKIPVNQVSGASVIERDGKSLRIIFKPGGIPFEKPAHLPCYNCGSAELWESRSEVVKCSVCHPPASEKIVLRRWNVFEKYKN